MRCPKCGYISFDRLNNCDKCGKDISAASAKLNGIILDIKPPNFLEPEVGPLETENDAISETVELGMEAGTSVAGEHLGGIEQTLDFDSDQDTIEAIDLDEETNFAVDLEETKLDINNEIGMEETLPKEVDLDDDLDVGIEEALDLEKIEADQDQEVGVTADITPESKDEQDLRPQLDLEDIDLSDLAPPTDVKEDEIALAFAGEDEEYVGEEDLGMAAEVDIDKMEVPETEIPAEMDREDTSGTAEDDLVIEEDMDLGESLEAETGLEDLFIDDIDLDSKTPLAAKDGAIPPTVKTGTALDNFDVDLGELITEKKE